MAELSQRSGALVFKRYLPYVVVFLASMGVMIIELTASRLVAKYFGTSLFTWTGVIGVVLGGISLGNYLGGKLADRFDPMRIMGPILLTTSLLILLVFVLDMALNLVLRSSRISFVTSRVVIRSVIMISVLFLLPSTAFGLVSPVMAKYALVQRRQIGHTVGNIYAVGAVGSIVGTFLSGYVLIPLLGIKAIIFLVAAAVAALALLVEGNRWLPAAWVAVLAVIYLATPAVVARPDVVYTTDSEYSHITVADTDRDGSLERVLILDGLIHNRYDRENPDNLLYEYERIFAALTRKWMGGRADRSTARTLTLGGGGMTFPTYLMRHYPSARNVVVEIDPQVERVARRYFDVPETSGLDVIIADARVYVAYARGSQTYGIVYLDAFNSYSVPAHLTTREFDYEVAELLDEDGLFLVNAIDIFSLGRFLGAYLGTLQEVFPRVAVYVSPEFDRDGRATFVLAASRGAALPERLTDEWGQLTARLLSEAEIAELLADGDGLRLTDDHAPVDNLMAPVFLRSVE